MVLHCPARPVNETGFTLLELVVVLFIIVVLTTLVAPALSKGNGRHVNDAVERMVLLLNQAQQEAVLTSRVWQAVIDPAADTYGFGRHTGGTFELFEQGPFAVTELAPAVDLGEVIINGQHANAGGEIYFYPTGEQDSFEMTFRAGEVVRRVLMGSVGPAEIVP